MPLGNGVNSRTISRDLAILTETHLYNIEIKVCGGSRRIAKEALAAQQALQMQNKPILGMIGWLFWREFDRYDGGCHPAKIQNDRAITKLSLFNCNATTVTRPIAVNPSILLPPSAQAKCSPQT
jgi:hypothetical protein